MILFNQAYTTNFSQFQSSQNSSQSSSNKHHKLPTLAKLHSFKAPKIETKIRPTTSQITNIAKIP